MRDMHPLSSVREYEATGDVREHNFGARRLSTSLPRWTTPDPLCEKYYSTSPYAYCAADPVNLIDPTGLKPTDAEAAQMCFIAYDDGDLELDGEWEWVENSTFNITDKKTGLQSRLFKRTNENGETEYALAFAGTQDAKDWLQNGLQLLGLPSQYTQAIELAGELAERYSGSELTLTGHSLGGGLSAAGAYATGIPAMTFNAAGVSALTIQKHTDVSIDAYVTWGDFLNMAAVPLINRLPGFNLPAADGRIYLRMPSCVNTHSINNFR